MKHSTILAVAGAIAIAPLLLAQFRWADAPRAEFRRKRAASLWAIAALALLLTAGHAILTERERPKQDPALTNF